MTERMQRMEEAIRKSGANLYDFALMTEDGAEELILQPANACNNSYSVAKSFIATAAGILWDEGKLDLDQPVTDILGGYEPADANWKRVTTRHALTHTMGVARGYLDIDVEDIGEYGTEDFLEVVFREPVPHEPGSFYRYSDAAYYLAARVVEQAAGEPADCFIMNRLFRPLKVQEAAWSRCPMNHPIGATGLYIRSRDMVKLGWLYANGGLYEGRQVISPRWIEEERCGGLAFQHGPCLGTRGKGGMYGQMLMFSEDRRFAAAWHGFDPEGLTGKLPAAVSGLF
ncbi:MAG: serine hydrolase [Clostridia bacterium]|nr:serine hydrolase [Clostridia bacterium]